MRCLWCTAWPNRRPNDISTTRAHPCPCSYKRLSPLEAAHRPVSDISEVSYVYVLRTLSYSASIPTNRVMGSEGDCVVVFSRKELFSTKRMIEKATGLSVGVIYGALPPATRKEQARAFNNPVGGYGVLAAQRWPECALTRAWPLYAC